MLAVASLLDKEKNFEITEIYLKYRCLDIETDIYNPDEKMELSRRKGK